MNSTVRSALCAAASAHWLAVMTRAALDAGFAVLSTDSAAQAIALCASHQPRAALVHEGLLHVDRWSTAEQLHLVCPQTAIILIVAHPGQWVAMPPFAAGVAGEEDLEGISKLLRRLRETV